LRAWTTRRWSLAAASAAIALLVYCAVVSGASDLLCLLPAALLACLLLARRYPGERALIALRRKRVERRWARPRSSLAARPRVLTAAVHGGLLIARSLAVRPPPAGATAA
jgi:hypothetical protein